MTLPPLYYIEWIDAVSDNGWEDLTETKGVPHKCITVGLLVKETKDALTFATTWSPSQDGGKPQTNARMTIPKDWIRKRRRIKL